MDPVPAGKADTVGEIGANASFKKALFGFEIMDDPVNVLGEVASESEEEKDRWRGREIDSGADDEEEEEEGGRSTPLGLTEVVAIPPLLP